MAGRPKKITVRYLLPSQRTPDITTCVQFKGVVSYNRKRLQFTISASDDVVIALFTAINPDGSLREDGASCFPPAQAKNITLFSRMLVNLRDAIAKIVTLAVKHNAWERMTASDLKALITFLDWSDEAQPTNLNKVIGRNGLFYTWLNKTI